MITEFLYEEIIDYTGKFINRKVGATNKIDAVEIVHNLIVDDSFSPDNWKSLVQKYFFQVIKNLRTEYIDVEYVNHEVIHKTEDIWRCEKCQDDQPKSYFRLSWRLCDKCYRSSRKNKTSEINRKSKARNKEKYRIKDKQWKLDNREHISNYMMIYRKKNKEHISSYNQQYKNDNKEKIKIQRRAYYLKTKK